MHERAKTRSRTRLQGLAALLLLLLLALAAGPAAAGHSATEPSDGTVRSFRAVDPPRAVPDFAFFDGAGRTVGLGALRGKVVLLNLWATWCPPCIRELPALDRLQGRLGGESFTVLALSLDRSPAQTVAAFLRRLEIRHLDLYVDPHLAAQAAFPVDVLPASFILDRQGRVVAFLRSYADWDAPEADEMIRGYLAAGSD
jgi:thiol-disulfide isomerase/thioredoxin